MRFKRGDFVNIHPGSPRVLPGVVMGPYKGDRVEVCWVENLMYFESLNDLLADAIEPLENHSSYVRPDDLGLIALTFMGWAWLE